MQRTLVIALAALVGLAMAPAAGAHDGKPTVGGEVAKVLVAKRDAGPVAGAANHSNWECKHWADADPIHLDAPGSYSSYNCQGMGGDYVRVNGRGKYSGTVHHTLIHVWHIFLGDSFPYMAVEAKYHCHNFAC